MINAIFANPNWDDEKNDRQQRITELNQNFNEAIDLVRNPNLKKEQDIDWNDPWWDAHKRNFQKTRIMYGLDPDGKTMGEVLDFEEEQKKKKVKHSAIRELDQG